MANIPSSNILLSESSEALQRQLNIIEKWLKKTKLEHWRLYLNRICIPKCEKVKYLILTVFDSKSTYHSANATIELLQEKFRDLII